MSAEREEPGFAYVRKPECTALKTLGPSAAKLWIAIRATYSEYKDFACGSRDFKGWGIGREAAGAALKALVKAGLLRVVQEGSFGRRGNRTVFSIVHKRAATASPNTAGKSANSKTDMAGKPANQGRQTRQLGDITAGKPATPLGAPRPSASEPKGRGEDAGPAPATAGPSPDRREAGRKALRDQLVKIEAAATAVAIPIRTFIEKAGGREAAGFFARKFARGDLTPRQLRAALADPPISRRDLIHQQTDDAGRKVATIAGAA